MIENYCLLFVDTFFANLVVTASREMANDVMLEFGYSAFLVISVTVIAALCSCYANYFFGCVLFNLYKYSTDQKLQDTYEKWQDFSKNSGGEYFVICNILGGIGNVIGVVAGFLRMNLARFTFFVLSSRVAYYSFVFLW